MAVGRKIRVHVLTTYASPNSLALLYPLLVNRRIFRQRGVEFSFFDRLHKRLSCCDVLFLNSKFFRRWHTERERRLYDVLAELKKCVQRLVWFDTTDSSGTTQFNVMPYVDVYCKSQLLKDRSLYGRRYYGNRIFTDYYRNLFSESGHVEDDTDRKDNGAVTCTLRPQDVHKLYVSWNSAMNEWVGHDYAYAHLRARLLAKFLWKSGYSVRFTEPGRKRDVDIMGRIGLSHKRRSVRMQREKIVSILRDRFSTDVAIIPRSQYLREIDNAKIGVSPFGLGEISCRDFEVIIHGALLLKQDMSHLETWPPLYRDNETYIPFAWDLRNFENTVRSLLKEPERITAISRKAQETYKYYLYGDGRMEFCERVGRIIGIETR